LSIGLAFRRRFLFVGLLYDSLRRPELAAHSAHVRENFLWELASIGGSKTRFISDPETEGLAVAPVPRRGFFLGKCTWLKSWRYLQQRDSLSDSGTQNPGKKKKGCCLPWTAHEEAVMAKKLRFTLPILAAFLFIGLFNGLMCPLPIMRRG